MNTPTCIVAACLLATSACSSLHWLRPPTLTAPLTRALELPFTPSAGMIVIPVEIGEPPRCFISSSTARRTTSP